MGKFFGVMCFSKGDSLKDRATEQDDGFGLGIGSVAEVIDVAIGA